jgi:DegV family protein with EDD domain
LIKIARNQVLLIGKMMTDIAIVTDSTADIPLGLLEKFGIHVVPNVIVIDGKSVEDGKEFSRQEFYAALPNMRTFPTTSTASPGVYQRLYENILKGGTEHIVSIHASSLLSGIFNAARLGAQSFGEQVHVIDGENISLGLGFQVLAAAEAALTQPLTTVLSTLNDVRKRVRVIAMLDTLEYIRRSGRVSWARARLGELLQIKPFVEVKGGDVINLGEVRTRRKGIKRLQSIIREAGPLEHLAILHTDAEEDARPLALELSSLVPKEPLLVNVTTVIGTHVGPNGLGFAAVVK